jgi:hypothetical protein
MADGFRHNLNAKDYWVSNLGAAGPIRWKL